MQKNWKLLVFGAFSLIVISCTSTTEKYEEMLEGWVGKSERELTEEWGRPSRTYDGKNRNKVLYYIKFAEGRSLASYDISGDVRSSRQMQCRTKFILNRSGRVVDWKWEGDACEAQED